MSFGVRAFYKLSHKPLWLCLMTDKQRLSLCHYFLGQPQQKLWPASQTGKVSKHSPTGLNSPIFSTAGVLTYLFFARNGKNRLAPKKYSKNSDAPSTSNRPFPQNTCNGQQTSNHNTKKRACKTWVREFQRLWLQIYAYCININ